MSETVTIATPDTDAYTARRDALDRALAYATRRADDLEPSASDVVTYAATFESYLGRGAVGSAVPDGSMPDTDTDLVIDEQVWTAMVSLDDDAIARGREKLFEAIRQSARVEYGGPFAAATVGLELVDEVAVEIGDAGDEAMRRVDRDIADAALAVIRRRIGAMPSSWTAEQVYSALFGDAQ